MFHAALSLLLLSALAPARSNDAVDPLEGLNRVDRQEASPHVAWGLPLDRGPLRVLFIGPRFAMRDVVEVAQRLDIEFATAPLWDSTRLGAPGSVPTEAGDKEMSERLGSLLAKEWDVIALGNFLPQALSESAWQAIAAHVQEGAGLVAASFPTNGAPAPLQDMLDGLEPAETTAFTRGVGESLTPEWRAGLDFVTASRSGKGRTVFLNYRGNPPQTHFLLPGLSQPLLAEEEHFEAYCSLVTKALLWSAGRDLDTWIDRLEPIAPAGATEEQIPPIFPEEYVELLKEATVRQPFTPYRMYLNQAAPRDYGVRVQVRQPGRNRTYVYDTYETDIPLRKGQTEYDVALSMGAGLHYVDLWLLDKGKVVDWHTSVVDIKAWPEFRNLKFSKDSLLPNDTLGVALDILHPLHEQLYRDRTCAVVVRATDSLERIVATTVRNLPERSGHVELDLDIADVPTSAVKVEVFVVDMPSSVTTEGRELTEFELQRAAYAFRHFPVRQPESPGAFRWAVRGNTGGEYNGRTFCRILAGLGADTLYSEEGVVGAFFAGEAGMAALPCLVKHWPQSVADGKRAPCLTDPQYLRAEADYLEKALTDPWVQAAPEISLGHQDCLTLDETNVCQSPTCLAGFRATLQADYGTIERLNADWKTNHADWDAVVPATEEEARKSGAYGPWVDFRQYMNSVFTSIYTFDRDMLASFREAEQGAVGRVGMSGGRHTGPYSGYDWPALAAELDALAVPFEPLAVEKVRSFRRSGATTSLLVGGDPSGMRPELTRAYPWYALLHGMNGLLHEAAFAGAGYGTPWVALAPDGRPFPATLALREEIVEIRGGLDAVLNGAPRVDAPVAIYDSPASYLVSVLDRSFTGSEAPEQAPLVKATKRDARDIQTSFMELLGDLGYGFDFVSPAQAAEGALKKYKVLLLPMARALSDEEAQAIQAFAAAGGTVVADVAPGDYDRHGTRREAPALASVFGVQWTQPPQAAAPSTATVTLEGKDAAELSEVIADGSTQAAGATAQGSAAEAPIWFRNVSGDGTAVLMNHAMPDYGHLSEGDARALRGLMGSVLANAGAQRAVTLSAANDGFHGECMAYRFGKATVYAVLRSTTRGADEEKAELRLSSSGNVYNLREGVAVRGKKVNLRLRRGEAAVFSELPYAVTGVQVECAESVAPGRRIPIHVAVETRGGLPDRHVVRLELAPVGGAPLPHYGKTVICEEGKGTTYIPLGQTEKAGMYRVLAWDVLSGSFGEAPVKVLASPSDSADGPRR